MGPEGLDPRAGAKDWRKATVKREIIITLDYTHDPLVTRNDYLYTNTSICLNL